jgi:hypothetical protein
MNEISKLQVNEGNICAIQRNWRVIDYTKNIRSYTNSEVSMFSPNKKDVSSNNNSDSSSPIPLTDLLRGATQGHSSFHSAWFRSMCPAYHNAGETWSNEKLEKFFCEGLLQHYVAVLANYDFEYNYKQFNSNDIRILNYDRQKFISLLEAFEIDIALPPSTPHAEVINKALPWVDVISELYVGIKKVSPLVVTGMEYQALKRQNEIVSKKITDLREHTKENIDTKEMKSAAKELLGNDKKLDDLQQAIISHVVGYRDKIVSFLKERHYDLPAINRDKAEFSSNFRSNEKNLSSSNRR